MKKPRVFYDAYGFLGGDRLAGMRLHQYALEELSRVLRGLMRSGMNLRDAERMVLLCSGEAANMIQNQDHSPDPKIRKKYKGA